LPKIAYCAIVIGTKEADTMTIISYDSNEQEFNRLFALWDGMSQWVLDGAVMYRVSTPFGPDRPLFESQAEESLYGGTSFQMSEPPTHKRKKAGKRGGDVK
jgi:hypothetical protein